MAIDVTNAGAIVERHRREDGTYALTELAVELGQHPDLWMAVVEAADGTHRHWTTVFDGEDIDIYAISWLPEQTTGFHDHCDSSFGVVCVRGAVYEDRPKLHGEVDTKRLDAGGTTGGVPGVMHVIRHCDGEPAVTIHAYSPRLERVGQIFFDRNGNWVRRERDGKEELTEGLLPC